MDALVGPTLANGQILANAHTVPSYRLGAAAPCGHEECTQVMLAHAPETGLRIELGGTEVLVP